MNVDLDRLKVSWVRGFDSFCYSLDQCIIRRVLPAIEIVAVQPSNVGETFVATAEILSIGVCAAKELSGNNQNKLK